MGRSQIFLFICLSFIIGVFLFSFFHIPKIIVFEILFLSFLNLILFWKKEKIVVFSFCLFFLSFGILHTENVYSEIEKTVLKNYRDQKVVLIGLVKKEPRFKEKKIDWEISIIQIITKDKKIDVNEKILMILDRQADYYKYGDKIKITGKLKKPKNYPDFNYQDFLKKDKIYNLIYYPKIEILEKDKGDRIFAKILNFKEKLRNVIYKNLSSPHNLVIGAIILGDKDRIPLGLKKRLNKIGLSHILAISGMHISILAGILFSLCLGLGLWRQQAFYFTLLFLTIYIILIAAPISAIRAGIMGAFYLLAMKLGRLTDSLSALIFVAFIMLIFNPLLLKQDISFQLSFSAVLGIILLSQKFKSFFSFIPEDLNFIKETAALTLSAQIFTLPILIYNFGFFSLVSPITNVLVVPLVPFIIILCFSAIFFSFILKSFSWILFLPVLFLSSFILAVVFLFSKLPILSF